MPPLRIAVLTHEMDGFDPSAYLVGRLMDHWEAEGMEIVVVAGTENAPPADVAVMHVDLTVTPGPYRRLARSYPVVVNGGVHDISKRSFSRLGLRPGDAWDGPVIVKTDANYGGQRERRLAFLTDLKEGRVRRGEADWGDRIHLKEYPVLDSLADVPADAWSNPALVVERFAPERLEDGTFALRIWVFLGDREIYYRCIASEPFVKSGTTLRREFLDPATVPSELRETRARLGFDYGKFDFAHDGDGPRLFDANRTPGFPAAMTGPARPDDLLRDLAGGIHSLIPSGRRP